MVTTSTSDAGSTTTCSQHSAASTTSALATYQSNANLTASRLQAANIATNLLEVWQNELSLLRSEV
jgi:activator of HSP90 ATPase